MFLGILFYVPEQLQLASMVRETNVTEWTDKDFRDLSSQADNGGGYYTNEHTTEWLVIERIVEFLAWIAEHDNIRLRDLPRGDIEGAWQNLYLNWVLGKSQAARKKKIRRDREKYKNEQPLDIKPLLEPESHEHPDPSEGVPVKDYEVLDAMHKAWQHNTISFARVPHPKRPYYHCLFYFPKETQPWKEPINP